MYVCMYVCMCVCTYVRTYVCMYECMYVRMYVRTCRYVRVYIFAKKCEANQKPQWLYKRPKTLISSKAKKLNILLRILSLESHTIRSLQGTFTTMIGFVTWPPYKR